MKRFLLGFLISLSLTFPALPVANAISIEPRVSADHMEGYDLSLTNLQITTC